MSSGAWLKTAADVITAVAAAGGAVVGGVWAYFRYRRQAPDVPRVNALVSATLFSEADRDYVVVQVELRHMAGGSLTIERDGQFEPPHPVVEVSRLTDDGTADLAIKAEVVGSVEVLRDQTELDAGEFATDHKVMSVGPRMATTIAYEVRLRLAAGWKGDTWEWCANAIVAIAGPNTATGSTMVGAPPT